MNSVSKCIAASEIMETLVARIPRPGSEEMRRSTPLQVPRKVLRIRRAWQLCCVCSIPRAMPLAIKTDWEGSNEHARITAEASLGPAKVKYQGNAQVRFVSYLCKNPLPHSP
jgi:hypothetical protein